MMDGICWPQPHQVVFSVRDALVSDVLFFLPWVVTQEETKIACCVEMIWDREVRVIKRTGSRLTAGLTGPFQAHLEFC